MAQDGARPTILVADDDEDLRALLAKALGTQYEVRLAADGGDALTIAAQAPPPATAARASASTPG